jgi:hypothetical protein
MNNFSSRVKFKFQIYFELQIQEAYKIWILFEFIGASNLWRKILIIHPKYILT